jgi:hypothetical protein
MAAELIRTPDVVALIHRAIVRGLREGAQIVRNFAVLNVTGKVLKRDTGRLASSIATAVTETGGGGVLRVGTQVKYGAYWEHGFFRTAGLRRFKPRGAPEFIFRWVKPKYMTARPWLRPAVDQALPQVTRRIQLSVEREIQQNFAKSVTIEIRVA